MRERSSTWHCNLELREVVSDELLEVVEGFALGVWAPFLEFVIQAC
jgi:hypothetical protein